MGRVADPYRSQRALAYVVLLVSVTACAVVFGLLVALMVTQ